MATGIYQLARIPILRRCNGYYLRWYYNGWHYWYFLPGRVEFLTAGEDYRTLGTQRLTMGSGQINEEQCNAIRTIKNTREIYIWTDFGWWGCVRIEAGSVIVYDHALHGYEIELSVVVGSRTISQSGFSPAVVLPSVEPDPPCEVDIAVAGKIWMCANWDADFPGSKVYNDDEDNRVLFGGLYTWAQVMSAGFVPAGWHVPTYAEFLHLITEVGGLLVAGGELKEAGTTHWDAPNTGAVDTYGYAAFGGGRYGFKLGVGTQFHDLYRTGFFWTQTGFVRMDHDSAEVVDGEGIILPNEYYSLRLIKDQVINTTPPVATPATLIYTNKFTANWNAYAGATEYLLDVATDAGFVNIVNGYSNYNVGNVTSFVIIGLDAETDYYYRIKAYSETFVSVHSNTISTTTAFALGLETSGDGTGVTRLTITTSALVTLTLDGVGKFYSDAGGTLDESSTWDVNGTTTLYIKCTAGISIFSFSDPSKVTQLAAYGGGTVNSPSLTGNPIIFMNLTELNISSASNFDLDIADLTHTLTTFRLVNGNSLYGDLSELPPLLQICALNTPGLITGSFADLPASLTSFYLNYSTASGDIADLPAGLTYCYLKTSGAIKGDIANLPVAIETFQIMSDSAINGDIANLPATVKYLILYEDNAITGDIADLPAGMIEIIVYGQNTLYGNISALSALPMTVFRITGSSNFSGALSSLPATMTFFYVNANTISGSLNDVPVTVYYFDVQGSNTISNYTAGKVWANDMWIFRCVPAGGSGLDATEVDNLLIDLANSAWSRAVLVGSGACDLRGGNASRTNASDVAVATIQGYGVTVYTN